jgi:uncharacterized Zn-binding protein involved in type VI secretion
VLEEIMRLIGWIREGDRAACDGLVIEGDQRCTSDGRAYAFEGAHMVCRNKCVIAEGFTRRTLTNGRKAVIHGMKTSGGCPLLSTLNDHDGVGNETGADVPTSFFLNADGHWTAAAPTRDKPLYDERVKLQAPRPDGMHYLAMTKDGRTFSGRVGPDGLLPRIDTFGEDEYSVLWGDEALAKTTEGQGDE